MSPREHRRNVSPAHLLDGMINTVMGQAGSLQEPGSRPIVFTQNRQEKVFGRDKFILQPSSLLYTQIDNSYHARCDRYLSWSDVNDISPGAGAQDGIQPFGERVRVYFQEFQELRDATLRLFN